MTPKRLPGFGARSRCARLSHRSPSQHGGSRAVRHRPPPPKMEGTLSMRRLGSSTRCCSRPTARCTRLARTSSASSASATPVRGPHPRGSSWQKTSRRSRAAVLDNLAKGTDNLAKGTDNRANGTDSRAKGTDNRALGIDDSAGFHTIAVDSHGKAFAFGNGRSGRLGVGHVANCLTPTPLAVPAVAAVAASLTFSVFALVDGTLWHTGDCETLGEAPIDRVAVPEGVTVGEHESGTHRPAALHCTRGLRPRAGALRWRRVGTGAAAHARGTAMKSASDESV